MSRAFRYNLGAMVALCARGLVCACLVLYGLACACLVLYGLACAVPGRSFAAEFVVLDAEVEQAAAKLAAATVTVRVLPSTLPQPREENALPENALLEKEPSREGAAAESIQVAVCSGVSLGEGLIVSFARPATDVRFRVTLPGGAQADGELRVVDRHSGLVLLEIADRQTPGLELTDASPAIGAAVLTAAAEGIEAPTISLGILGGVDRSLPGERLPLLLQCDVRTTATSCGAALVDRQGRLAGIVVKTPDANDRQGWTYAVPAEFVRRLTRARVPNEQVTLEHRRPVIGMTLSQGPKEGTVVVERVAPEGPAEQAGVRASDMVAAAAGRKIRSAYQVVHAILNKQPGDSVELTIERDGESKTLSVVLEGGGVVPADEPKTRGQAAGKVIVARRRGDGGLEVAPEGESSPGKVVEDEVQYLRRQLNAFRQVVDGLQRELAERDEQQRQTDELVKSMMQEIARLKQDLDDRQPDPAPPDKP